MVTSLKAWVVHLVVFGGNFKLDDPATTGRQPKPVTLHQPDRHCADGRTLVVTTPSNLSINKKGAGRVRMAIMARLPGFHRKFTFTLTAKFSKPWPVSVYYTTPFLLYCKGCKL
jgi:hypothetical protein